MIKHVVTQIKVFLLLCKNSKYVTIVYQYNGQWYSNYTHCTYIHT